MNEMNQPTELDCKRVADLLVDFVTEEVDSNIRQAIEAHLKVCPDCTSFLNTYRKTIESTRSITYDEIPPEMQERLHGFLRSKIEPNRD
jgi:hypothetical protein